jgi:phage baseplate assembly protein W
MANTSKIRGISFPFRRGQFEFPAANEGAQTVVDSVRSLLLMGLGEVPFAPTLGATITANVFENISELQRVRLSQQVRSLIADREPRMAVQSVTVQEAGNAALGYRYEVLVVYTIADIDGDFNIPVL